MKILIADDEAIARQILREHLDDLADAEVIGEACDGLEAVEMTCRLHPDVLLLDQQMPQMDGFAVSRNLAGRRLPLLIYVTAFQEHALQAFEAGAVDYLLKPVRKERLEAALNKARAQLAGLRTAPPAGAKSRKIVGKLGTDLHLLETSDVIAFQAEGDLVFILTASKRYFAEHSLRALEQRLDPERFRRVHRSTIINNDHIRKISRLSSKRWLLTMSNGLEVIVSKRLSGRIRDEAQW